MVKIGVFPASGGLGMSVVNHLLKLVPADQLILINRYPEKLEEQKAAGAVVRRADYDDLQTLDHAFVGVDVLMLISYPSPGVNYRIEAHRRAIDAATRSSVSHIFYSSLGFASGLAKTSVAQVMQAHLSTERYLEQLQAPTTYTAIREGLYSESYYGYFGLFDPRNPVEEIKIPHPGDGPGVAWVKRDELGEATAKLITSYVESPKTFAYTNKTLLLSGAKAISLRETADIIGRIIDKPLKITEVPESDFRDLPHIISAPQAEEVGLANHIVTALDAMSKGETAVVTPHVRDIIGREQEDFETTLREELKELEKTS